MGGFYRPKTERSGIPAAETTRRNNFALSLLHVPAYSAPIVALSLLSQVCMVLSADALEIIAYLKTDSGRFMSLREISRRAAGRRRFEESPGWARNLMQPLIEAGLVQVNSRGHYRVPVNRRPQAPSKPASHPDKPPAKIVGDDYFPTNNGPRVIAGDYFPSTD